MKTKNCQCFFLEKFENVLYIHIKCSLVQNKATSACMPLRQAKYYASLVGKWVYKGLISKRNENWDNDCFNDRGRLRGISVCRNISSIHEIISFIIYFTV